MRRRNCIRALVVLILLTTCANAADLAPLLKDIDSLPTPGLPGTVCAFSDAAFVVVAAPTGRNLRQPLIAASHAGKAKAVVFGHDGYFAPVALKEADATPLLLNLIAWASPKPKIATLNLRDLADYLKSQNLPAEDVKSTDALAGYSIVFLTNNALRTDADLANLRKYLDAGGAVFVAHTGWGWVQTHSGKTLADDMPANRLLAPLGLAFGDGTIEKDKQTNGVKINKTPSPALHAKSAFDLLAAPATPELLKEKKNDFAQASDTIAHVARAAPADAPFLQRLNQLKSRTDLPLPSPEKPLKPTDGLARVALSLQLQDIVKAPPEKVKPHPAAAAFPGAIPAGARRVQQTVSIDPRIPRWHSTGLYAAPGEIVTVTIPQDATGLNLKLRIGQHTDRTYHLPNWRRAPEISRQFKLDQPVTRAANAFGGLIYIDVPDNTPSPSPFEVTIANAVPAPLFVLGKTSVAQWRDQICSAPAPWAEIATDKLIITLKSQAVRNLDDPTPVCDHWNKVMDATATLAAWPLARKSPERMVSDTDISAGYMHSGYPIMTGLDVTDAFVDLKKLRSPNSGWGFYHEIGHNHQNPDWTFAGTTEVTVNLFTMHTLETVCGATKEESTKRALGQPDRLKKYLANPDFNTWQNDAFLALAMYAQLRLEFGWEPYKNVFADYRALPRDQRPRTEEEKRDQWMTRMSKQVNRNLGPFFQAWGVPTSDAARKSVADLPPWMPEGFPPRQ
jgi:hypothetical protein